MIQIDTRRDQCLYTVLLQVRAKRTTAPQQHRTGRVLSCLKIIEAVHVQLQAHNVDNQVRRRRASFMSEAERSMRALRTEP
jgi:hypothetical protein